MPSRESVVHCLTAAAMLALGSWFRDLTGVEPAVLPLVVAAGLYLCKWYSELGIVKCTPAEMSGKVVWWCKGTPKLGMYGWHMLEAGPSIVAVTGVKKLAGSFYLIEWSNPLTGAKLEDYSRGPYECSN